jgi:hypothetical protein
LKRRLKAASHTAKDYVTMQTFRELQKDESQMSLYPKRRQSVPEKRKKDSYHRNQRREELCRQEQLLEDLQATE